MLQKLNSNTMGIMKHNENRFAGMALWCCLALLTFNAVDSKAQPGDDDPTFNQSNPSLYPGGGLAGDILKTLLLSNGKMLVAGNFTTFNGIGRNMIARLNADGTLDNTF